METIEYRTHDKTSWGHGPWSAEPDKAQWADADTGLPCLAVRNHGGAWCGYVGVPEGHPAHGKPYDEVDVEVHGGLTFASRCADLSPAALAQYRARLPEHRAEARKHPRGDSARWLRDWEPVLGDETAWKARAQATSICHVPAPGEPDDVWWLGFDCGHSGDMHPAYRDEPFASLLAGGIYRTLDYVRDQVRALAAQLAPR